MEKNIENQNIPDPEELDQDEKTTETEPIEDNEEKKDKHGKHKHRKDEADKYLNEISELKDKYLRLFSEYDNYRKRTLKEKIELSKTASTDVITALLPILDDFERAIKTMEDAGENGAHQEGMSLIYNKMKNFLLQQGLEVIQAMGEEFDTDFHEAITNIPAPAEQKGKVLDVVQQGYTLGGKVIRFAKVVVGN